MMFQRKQLGPIFKENATLQDSGGQSLDGLVRRLMGVALTLPHVKASLESAGQASWFKRISDTVGIRIQFIKLPGTGQLIQKASIIPLSALAPVETTFEIVRGLICIPASDECADGHLPDGTCSSSWTRCDGDKQPYRHVIAQATGSETYLPAYHISATSPPAYRDTLGPEYGRIDWIGPNIGTEEAPEYRVLSWRSDAARYATIQPESSFLYYRGDPHTGLPSFEDCKTFLGAAVCTLDDAEYLVAAVLIDDGSDVIIAENWENWTSTWLATPHRCLGETSPQHHGHYPVSFFARAWRETPYSNDDAYNATTNQYGWRDLGSVDCQSYTPENYTRVFARPRVLANVHFAPASDGTVIQCCWCCVDEWTYLISPSSSEDVYHITGYQVAEVGLSGASEITSELNPEDGATTQQNNNICVDTSSDPINWGCSPEDWHPEWGCASPHIDTQSEYASFTVTQVRGTNSVFSPYVIAVDFDREGTLVVAKIKQQGINTNNEQGSNGRICDHTTTLEYWCDPGESPPSVDGVGSIDTLITTEFTRGSRGTFAEWILSASGGNVSMTIPWVSSKTGSDNSSTTIFNDQVVSGQEVWCLSLDPPGYVYPTICGVGGVTTSNVTNTESQLNHSDSQSHTKLHWLDLRFGSAAYAVSSYNNYTGTVIQRSYSATNGVGSGTASAYSVTRTGVDFSVYVMERGTETLLAEGQSGTDTETLISSTAWTPGSHGICSACGPDTIIETPGADIDYPIKDRQGIENLFKVEGYKASGSRSWTLETVNTDYGSSDEHGNMLAAWQPSVIGYLGETYQAPDFGLPAWAFHLTGAAAEEYYNNADDTEPRGIEIGIV
jgi:hypothetical protein